MGWLEKYGKYLALGMLSLVWPAVDTLGWVIREATTNVIRHSGAKRCSITLGRDDGLLQIEVANDGWRVPQAPAGNGLRGLDERLAAVGGKLEAHALPTAGFRLWATLPSHPRSMPADADVEVTT